MSFFPHSPTETLKVFVILFIFAGAFISITASGADSENIEQYTLQNPKTTSYPDYLLIEYLQKNSELKDLREDLADIALLLTKGNSKNYSQVRIRQYYDDGQILEICGSPSDGEDYLQGDMSVEEFIFTLEFSPLTRGSAITGKLCEPDKGESCSNCVECSCYPNEICSPSSSDANRKGCIVVREPENAHKSGSEYICNEGYQWRSDGTGCIPVGTAGSAIENYGIGSGKGDIGLLGPPGLEIILVLLFGLWCGFILARD